MTNWNKNGGSAFPNPGYDNGPGNCRSRPDEGMSLRDWFAGQALPAIMSMDLDEDQTVPMMAKAAYEWADAMLAARGADQ